MAAAADPTVSVLVTSYNVGEYVQGALDSLIAQTFTDWEAIVMDDGSTDPETIRVLESVTDPRITVHRFYPTEQARGQTARYASLINLAAQHARGRYLTYLCTDDFYMPDRLKRMVDLLDQGHQVVYGAQLLMNEQSVPFGVRQTEGVLTSADSRVDLNSFMHTRESFDLAGGWDDNPMLWRIADAYFFRRLSAAGYVLEPVPGEPTDSKRYRNDGVDARCIRGERPW
jgi:glycosyltransferase involved in cell wall biosynthesis